MLAATLLGSLAGAHPATAAAAVAANEVQPRLLVIASDAERTVALTLARPCFALAAGESLHPALAPGFTADFDGLLVVVRGGRYEFTLVADGGRATGTIAGRAIDGGAVTLAAGEIPFHATFVRDPTGPARFNLEWKSDHFEPEPIPARCCGHRGEPAPFVEAALVERGRRLAQERACFRCHVAPAPARADQEGEEAPDLSAIGARTHAAWIEQWLGDPRAFRPTATMPRLVLDAGERKDIAGFLAGLAGAPTASNPAAPKPSDPAAPTSTGAAAAVVDGAALFTSIGCAACHGPDGGDLRRLGEKTGEKALTDYLLDPARVDRSGRMPALFRVNGGSQETRDQERKNALAVARFLTQRLPDGAAASASNAANTPHGETRPAEPGQKPDPGSAARGAALVRSKGCLACHALREGVSKESRGTPLMNESSAPAFATLRPDAGCLAEQAGTAPDFGLAPGQREALRAFVAFYRHSPDRSSAPLVELDRTLARLRCTSCHEWNDQGPVESLQESAPPLTVVGAKMRSSWLDAVLTKHRRVRPWLHLQMPRFEARAVAPLVAQFAAAAGVAVGEGEPDPPAPREERLHGVELLGSGGGFACIGCHDFRDYEALGSRGPGLTEMHARLRPEYFRHWMLQPLRLIPGTSMPRFFSDTPPDETRRQLDRVWAGLALAEFMPPPPGLVGRAEDTGRAEPGRRPLLQRTFMPESSPASIAVALPGSVNYCFDTVECRVRYAWDGDFLDLRPQWAFKGEKLPVLLGRIFARTTAEFGVRIGEPDALHFSFPSKPRFRGWRMHEGLPELHYDVYFDPGLGKSEYGRLSAPARILLRIEPAVGAVGLIHRYRVGETNQPIWFHDGGTGGLRRIADHGPVEFEIPLLDEDRR